MRHTPIVLLLIASPLFVLQFQPGLCTSTPAPEHSNEFFEEEHSFEDDDDEDDNEEGVDESFLEEEDESFLEEDEEDNPPGVPEIPGGGEPGEDHPMSQSRRRGVLEEGEEATEAPLAEAVPEETTTTTPYPLGVVGPDPLAVDPHHTQELGPVNPWPTGGANTWGDAIAQERPASGMLPVNECQGRRRSDRRRVTCKGNYRRRRRTEHIYGDRVSEECGDRRRVSDRRRICEAYGTRRRRSRRRDPALLRRRRTRRRRIEIVVDQKSKPVGDRRRRYNEGDGIYSSFSLHEDDSTLGHEDSSVLADDSISQTLDKVDTSKVPDYNSLLPKITGDPREFDKAFKSISGEAGNLLDKSSEALKQLDDNLNSSDDSTSVDKAAGSDLHPKPLASPGTLAQSLSVDAQAALLRRHLN